MKKAAFLFPGIGYTCDKPLLYYSWKTVKSLGWEVIPVRYSGFPDGVKGNPDKMRLTARMALEKTEEILRDIRWSDYGQILLIGKSLGTVVCTEYAERHGISCRQILFTPVEDTFRAAVKDAVVFHGTADPWAETKAVEEHCRRLNLPLYKTEGANHSLETGDVETDIGIMKEIMKTVREYAGRA